MIGSRYFPTTILSSSGFNMSHNQADDNFGTCSDFSAFPSALNVCPRIVSGAGFFKASESSKRENREGGTTNSSMTPCLHCGENLNTSCQMKYWIFTSRRSWSVGKHLT